MIRPCQKETRVAGALKSLAVHLGVKEGFLEEAVLELGLRVRGHCRPRWSEAPEGAAQEEGAGRETEAEVVGRDQSLSTEGGRMGQSWRWRGHWDPWGP